MPLGTHDWQLKYFVSCILYLVYKTLFQSPAEGAQPVLFCALEDSVEPGGYYMDCRLYDHTLWVPKSAYDEGLAKKLWESTERILFNAALFNFSQWEIINL